LRSLSYNINQIAQIDILFARQTFSVDEATAKTVNFTKQTDILLLSSD
jgi:hypothetical protein